MTLLFWLAVLFVLVDLYLLVIMAAVIRFFCPLCLLTYGVNIALLVVSARALGRPWRQALGQSGAALGALIPSAERPAAWTFWGVMFIGLLGTTAFHAATRYLGRGSLGSMREQIREFVSGRPRVTLAVAGDPSVGPASAPIEMIEFSDFFCPACQRASKMNTVILANHREQIRLVFKHFPLDTSCNDTVSHNLHPGACRVAAASECAHLQGVFWPFHDVVFEQGKDYQLRHAEEDLRRLGADLQQFRACMASGQGLEAVKRDIAEGGRVGVKSTPTYVINGLPVAGGLNPSTFEDFIAVLREPGR
jgi:protein-disulfide isomerase